MRDDFIPASEETLQHHVTEHAAECEIEDPSGVWLWCEHKTFAAVMCTGCFEMIFAASHPNKNHRCEHNDAFFDHIERHLCQEI